MLFMTQFDIIPGKADEMIYKMRNPKVPENVVIKYKMQLFGKPDFIIIYEAPDEQTALNFILQFTDCATPRTSLANPL